MTVQQLLAENRWRVPMANGLFIVGNVLFRQGYVASNEWRSFGLMIGTSILAPLLLLVGTTLGAGFNRTAEALVAFATSQKTPLWLVAGIWALVGAGFVAALVATACAA